MIIIVARPSSWNVPKWDINLENIPNSKYINPNLNQCNVLIWKWSKFSQQLKHTQTTSRMVKNKKKRKEKNTDKEQQNDNKQ
jgi:hypothetical protein